MADDDLQSVLEKLTRMFEVNQSTNSKATKNQNKLTREELKLRGRISEEDNETRRWVAELEAKSREQLSQREIEAAASRQAAELASRLQISNNEQAAAMARLEQELGVRREDIANQLTIARERIGFDREALAANIGVEREKIAQARDEMLKVGIPTMLVDKWKKEADVALAQEAQKIDREKIGVERGRLGLDAFSKAVDLASSPATRFQFGDFAKGLAENAQAADWLAAMAGETNRSGFGQALDAGVDPMDPMDAMAAMGKFLGVDPTTGQPVPGGGAGGGSGPYPAPYPGSGVPGMPPPVDLTQLYGGIPGSPGQPGVPAPYQPVADYGSVPSSGTVGGYGYNDAWSWAEANRLARAAGVNPVVVPAPGATTPAPGAGQPGGGGTGDPYNGTDPHGVAAMLGIPPEEWLRATQTQVGITDPGFDPGAAAQRKVGIGRTTDAGMSEQVAAGGRVSFNEGTGGGGEMQFAGGTPGWTNPNAAQQKVGAMPARPAGGFPRSYAEAPPTGTVGGYGYNDEWSFNEASRLARASGVHPEQVAEREYQAAVAAQQQAAQQAVPQAVPQTEKIFDSQGRPVLVGVQGQQRATGSGQIDFSGLNTGAAQPQQRQLSPDMQAYLDRQNAELEQIRKIADAGGGALAPGSLESLGKDKLQQFVSGLKKLRRDPDQWFSDYSKTRIYQGDPEGMAA